MAAKLSLVKNDIHRNEKRVFPRFPYCFLTFKANNEEHVFEVKDISATGMQLAFKDGTHNFKKDQIIKGEIHWLEDRVKTAGKVMWVTENRLGLKFDKKDLKVVKGLIKSPNIAKKVKALHDTDLNIELPSGLKYWLRADGPNEVFVWRHADGELARINMIFMENYVEWEDGKGVQTGRAITKRDLDTPLLQEDEFVFEMDDYVDTEKTELALDVIEHLSQDLMTPETKDFIRLKLGE